MSSLLGRPRAALAFALALGALLLGGAGCAPDAADGAGDEAAALGEVVLPLVEVGPDGATYRLRDAVFELHAADGETHLLDGNVEASEVSARLAPGPATLRLRAGWRMERSSDGTTYEPVGAVCTLPDPYHLQILPGATERLRVDFYLRDPRGTFAVVFHTARPHYLISGTLYVDEEATGAFAPYLGEAVELAVYFQVFGVQRVTEPDGRKSLVYRGRQNVFEFFNDERGAFADRAARALVSGSLELRVTANPDGSVELGVTHSSYSRATLRLDPAAAFWHAGLDDEGFPRDEDLSAATPFALQLRDADSSTARGTALFQKIGLASGAGL